MPPLLIGLVVTGPASSATMSPGPVVVSPAYFVAVANLFTPPAPPKFVSLVVYPKPVPD